MNIRRETNRESQESDYESLSRSSSLDMNAMKQALGSLTKGLEESSIYIKNSVKKDGFSFYKSSTSKFSTLNYKNDSQNPLFVREDLVNDSSISNIKFLNINKDNPRSSTHISALHKADKSISWSDYVRTNPTPYADIVTNEVTNEEEKFTAEVAEIEEKMLEELKGKYHRQIASPNPDQG